MNVLVTQHKLDFETAPFWFNRKGEPLNIRFRVGTCHGLYCSTERTYDIIAIENSEKGNGHLEDVFQWFENSCKRDRKNLRVVAILNNKFRNHLISKRGFHNQGPDNVIKYFDK